mmetsp:Transcript_109050/g.188857  ORF Transcript_109050/g.188857 Transcript_109050/m.188857 type:complete len:230 (-) Transcript_109050:749-1438(-)
METPTLPALASSPARSRDSTSQFHSRKPGAHTLARTQRQVAEEQDAKRTIRERLEALKARKLQLHQELSQVKSPNVGSLLFLHHEREPARELVGTLPITQDYKGSLLCNLARSTVNSARDSSIAQMSKTVPCLPGYDDVPYGTVTSKLKERYAATPPPAVDLKKLRADIPTKVKWHEDQLRMGAGKLTRVNPGAMPYQSVRRTRQYRDYEGRAYLVDLHDPPDQFIHYC